MAGHAKVGKSSFINAIRGMGPTDPGAAAVGVTEVTHVVRRYEGGPMFPHANFFDIPGSGTLQHPTENYFL